MLWCEALHTRNLPFELMTLVRSVREASMPGSLYNSERSHGIWPKIIGVPAIQAGVLLAISIAVIFCIDWTLGASRSKFATKSNAPVSAPGTCPQSADTFDRQRAACLRRRWSAMRDMKPWPGASQNALLEECLRSSRGDMVIPFKTNSCGDQKVVSRPGHAQN